MRCVSRATPLVRHVCFQMSPLSHKSSVGSQTSKRIPEAILHSTFTLMPQHVSALTQHTGSRVLKQKQSNDLFICLTLLPSFFFFSSYVGKIISDILCFYMLG